MEDAYLGTIVAWPIDFAPMGWMFCEGQSLAVGQYQALYSLLGNTYGGNTSMFNLPDLRSRVVIGASNSPVQGLPIYKLGQKMGISEADAVLPIHSHNIPSTGMNVDLSKGSLNVTASEMTIDSSGNFGLPITSENASASSSPTTSDYYLGTARMSNGTPVNTFYKPNTEPTVTTKPTQIQVTGKSTPSISATMSGIAPITIQSGTRVSDSGIPSGKIPLMQPGIALRYIICVNGLYPPRPY